MQDAGGGGVAVGGTGVFLLEAKPVEGDNKPTHHGETVQMSCANGEEGALDVSQTGSYPHAGSSKSREGRGGRHYPECLSSDQVPPLPPAFVLPALLPLPPFSSTC